VLVFLELAETKSSAKADKEDAIEKNIKRLIFRVIFFTPLALVFLLFFAQKANGQACTPGKRQSAEYFFPYVPRGVQVQPDGTRNKWVSDIVMSSPYAAFGVVVQFARTTYSATEIACPVNYTLSSGFTMVSGGAIYSVPGYGQVTGTVKWLGDDKPLSETPDAATRFPVTACSARISIPELCDNNGAWQPQVVPQLVMRMEDEKGYSVTSASYAQSKSARVLFMNVSVVAAKTTDPNGSPSLFVKTDTGAAITNVSYTTNHLSTPITLELFDARGKTDNSLVLVAPFAKKTLNNVVLKEGEMSVFMVSDVFGPELKALQGNDVNFVGTLRITGESLIAKIAGAGIFAYRKAGPDGIFFIASNPLTPIDSQ